MSAPKPEPREWGRRHAFASTIQLIAPRTACNALLAQLPAGDRVTRAHQDVTCERCRVTLRAKLASEEG